MRHTVNKVLPLKDTPHFLVCRSDVALWEPDLAQTLNVGERLAPGLQEDDRSLETEATLEEPGLVNDVHPSLPRAICPLVFRSEYEEGDWAIMDLTAHSDSP